jgi:hypothetical protein
MRSLVLRVLGLWFALIIVTSVAVLVVRADPESPTLKAVGLSLCEGAPCFRGLKVGSSWDEVLRRFPNAISHDGYLETPINIGGVNNVLIWPSDNAKTVRHIGLQPDSKVRNFTQANVTVSEIVARYGAPCLLVLGQVSGQIVQMRLIYPELNVAVDIYIGNPYQEPTKRQIQLTSPVSHLWISRDGANDLLCDSPLNEFRGRWKGFISANLYLARFRSNRVK